VGIKGKVIATFLATVVSLAPLADVRVAIGIRRPASKTAFKAGIVADIALPVVVRDGFFCNVKTDKLQRKPRPALRAAGNFKPLNNYLNNTNNTPND
jgi:hypothetical protein